MQKKKSQKGNRKKSKQKRKNKKLLKNMNTDNIPPEN